MSRHNVLLVALLVALLPLAGAAQQTSTIQALTAQGQYWLKQDDGKRAAEVWHKLLLVSPDNAQALYGLAQVELKARRVAYARDYLQRLRQAHPGHALVPLLEQEIYLSQGNNRAVLEQARLLAASQEPEKAVPKYRQALGERQPVGDLGREYYGYLGYTEGGLQEAIAGLRRLAAQDPENQQVQLWLARHLARNEPTRLDGIRRLAKLSTRADIGGDAGESWRDALTWLGPAPAAAQPLFTEYLQRHPDDDEIRQQLRQGVAIVQRQQAEQAKLRKQKEQQALEAQRKPPVDPLREQTDLAMKLLETGDTGRARAIFREVLAQRPDDTEALGGLGVVLMNEGDRSSAKEYLIRARRGNAAWQPALNDVQYWIEIDQAQLLLKAGDTAGARKRVQQAARFNPTEVTTAVLLADILRLEGNTAQAAQAYQKVLARHPSNTQALQGQAQIALAAGDAAQAYGLLERALAHHPDDVRLRQQLLALYRESGQTEQARQQLDKLLAAHPHEPELLYTSALLAADKQEWSGVLGKLDQIPLEQRSVAMNQLHDAAYMHYQLAQAQHLAHTGQKPQALKLLSQIEVQAGNNVEVLAGVAQMYVELGETAKGLRLLSPLRAQGRERSIDASIAYVSLLLASEQDVEAFAVLRYLQTQSLSAVQQAKVSDLNNAYQIHYAQLLIEHGDLAAAGQVLASLQKNRPDDAGVLGTQARMYVAQGRAQEAVTLYQQTLKAHPKSAMLNLGLAQASLALKDHRQAARAVREAVSLAPERSAVLVGAAKIYAGMGDAAKAAELMKKAQALSVQGLP